MPVGASVSSIETKTFVNGEVSWDTIGFPIAGVYHFKFHASGTLAEYNFNISSDLAILEILPSGRPASLHVLQQPGNAAPVISTPDLIRGVFICTYLASAASC